MPLVRGYVVRFMTWIFVFILCAGMAHAEAAAPALVPAPQKLVITGGEPFVLDPARTTVVADAALSGVSDYLVDALAPATGGRLNKASAAPGSPSITLKVDPSLALNDEGYRLTSSAAGVTIVGKTPAAVFYGVQTLRQLLPPQVFGSTKADDQKWIVPAVEIEDQPRFPWRGLHLDVCRHFFNKDEVKKYIDLLALHKLNTFHWHLTDDQGWRIDIKKYPKLTELGAWRQGINFGLDAKDGTAWGPDKRYGGFFTQDDIREVVAYAKERFVTVVPEIEMPGHAMSVLVGYPELACVGNTEFTTDLPGGIFKGNLCASNPNVDQFIADVLGEVLELFPSKYIHIGGDEVMKEPWHDCSRCQAYMKERGLKDEHELQSDFIRRADKFLDSRGRRLIGWDEILEGGLADGATVMSWRGVTGGIAAAKAGHDVVMTPGTHLYLDHYQADPKTQPKAIGGYTPLVRVYSYEPIPDELTAAEAKYVLGAQANLWSEYFPNFRQVEYMTYPRACALAEVTWSPKAQRNWDDFAKRLASHFARLDAMNVNYFKDAIAQPPPDLSGPAAAFPASRADGK